MAEGVMGGGKERKVGGVREGTGREWRGEERKGGEGKGREGRTVTKINTP